MTEVNKISCLHVSIIEYFVPGQKTNTHQTQDLNI